MDNNFLIIIILFSKVCVGGVSCLNRLASFVQIIQPNQIQFRRSLAVKMWLDGNTGLRKTSIHP